MHYKRVVIERYRAISEPLTIELGTGRLVPIIGVNECGKTTILHAIFAFDYVNDNLNRGRHLEDTHNLYEADPRPPLISADISLTKSELNAAIRSAGQIAPWKGTPLPGQYERKKRALPASIRITRNLETKKYSLALPGYRNPAFNDVVARRIVGKLPYILYFDDFTGSVDEKVEIDKESRSEWLAILDTLFKQTDPSFSVYDLPSKEVRQRKTVLSKVRRKLEHTLTREWKNFRLDDTDALTVSLDYKEEHVGDIVRSYITFEIVERDADGDEHFFFVRDRSKGFFWFFNFVMKLEFNPKVISSAGPDAIYLLDEPGSYLHAIAQEKLCAKLRSLSRRNHVIYCTHSHYLLNPSEIPLNSIRIAEKDSAGKVSLMRMSEHRGAITERRSAYQPVLDALQVRPFQMDLVSAPVLLVEGVMDYFALLMFGRMPDVTVVPCVGAPSMKFYISLMIAWRLEYRALWDCDPAGKRGYEEASNYFGSVEAARSFRLLPLVGGGTITILQNLIDGADIKMFKEKLALPHNTGFDKVLTTLFYADARESILRSIGGVTRERFRDLCSHLGWASS